MGNATRLQPAIQFGFAPMAVIEKGAVAVDVDILSLVKYRVDQAAIEARMKLGASGTLNAVIRPPDLRQPVEFAQRVDRFAGYRGEAAVVSRMPVLQRQHALAAGAEFARIAVGDRHGHIAFMHGHGAAGTKIVLNIYDDEGLLHNRWLRN